MHFTSSLSINVRSETWPSYPSSVPKSRSNSMSMSSELIRLYMWPYSRSQYACYTLKNKHHAIPCNHAAHCNRRSTLPLPSISSTLPSKPAGAGNAGITLGTCESSIPPALATRGRRYLDSLPLIMDNLFSIKCKYCLPCKNVSDVSPEDTCRTSARQPAMSESFCSMPMPWESRARGFARSAMSTVRRATSMG